MKKSRKPPSRTKYENNHPTISARLPKDKHDKLLALLRNLGVTLPQLLFHFIDEYEIKIMPIEEARKAGYEEAKNIYMVSYSCSGCGKPAAITNPETKEVVSKFLTKHGWGHKKCIEGTGHT